jgi:hypothetical protein
MSPSARCDEILRVIDDALDDAADRHGVTCAAQSRADDQRPTEQESGER